MYGKCQTACWHVDDLKLIHVDPAVNDKSIKKPKKKYETIEKGSIKVKRGNNHTCLGMIFDFSSTEEVKISMLDCIMELIKDFPESITKGKETPDQDWLFKVREEEEPILPQEKVE